MQFHLLEPKAFFIFPMKYCAPEIYLLETKNDPKWGSVHSPLCIVSITFIHQFTPWLLTWRSRHPDTHHAEQS